MFGGGLYWLIFGLSYGSAALIIRKYIIDLIFYEICSIDSILFISAHYLKPCSKNDGADCALKSAQYAVPFMLKGDEFLKN